jgi:error-prone DNA polymerase
VLVKDAQRHGLRVHPICVQHSGWLCAIEHEEDGSLSLRIGLNYAKGLRQFSANALLASRSDCGPYQSVGDLTRRVPELNRKELVLLAGIGALNTIGDVSHRRDAIWQVEQAGRSVGPLFNSSIADHPSTAAMPLRRMTTDERLSADYAGSGLTCGPHPMAYHRVALSHKGFLSSSDLSRGGNHQFVKIAGSVIARQRPGTAKGFVFLSLEDESGIANVIITPDLFERERLVVTRDRFLEIEGYLQIQNGVIHVKAMIIKPIDITNAEVCSHDFH